MEEEIVLLIVYMAILGAGIGTFSGLVPGIHVNTLATLMLSFYPALNDLLSTFISEGYVPICVSSCVVSAAVVHSFVDFIPSVFIGAPDPDDVAGMMPGHRLLSQGRGMSAVRSAAIGSCVGACVSVAVAIPLQYMLFAGLGDYLDSITSVVLIAVIGLLIIQEETIPGCVWAFGLVILSGMLGLACMDLPIPCSGPMGEGTLLFPLLTGLFGMPALLESLHQTNIVKQIDDDHYPVGPMPGLKGVITGCVTGWFPGITATAGAVLSNAVTPEKRPEGFISMIASIGTASSVIMLVTMSVTGKGRSGTMLVVDEILGDSAVGPMNQNFLLLLFAIAVASLLGYHITIACGKLMSSAISKIDVALLNKICIVLVVSLVILMTGGYGIAVLVISTAIGFIPIKAEISRMTLTGCLLLPTLLTYLGIRDVLLALLC